jgi:putative glutamine amidotransferase
VRKDNVAELDTYLDLLSGVVLLGGLDLDPRRQGQPLGAATQPMASRREESDRLLLAKVVERRLPVLGIGVGMQLINVHFGGTLFAHLPLDVPKAMPHFDPTGGPHRHMVSVEPNTTLQDMYGADELRVNSQHHQGVNQVGRRLRVAARAPDGVIEAVETTDDTWFCVGVQWHPEADTASALDRQIFDCLVQAAAKHEPAGELVGV